MHTEHLHQQGQRHQVDGEGEHADGKEPRVLDVRHTVFDANVHTRFQMKLLVAATTKAITNAIG